MGEARTSPRNAQDRAGRNSEEGGIHIDVSGTWASVTPVEVETAMLAALQQVQWAGLTRRPATLLQISGTSRDLPPTLNQIPTSAVSVSWTLSVGGRVVSRGGLSDLRGTGLDQYAAQAASIRRATREIAHELRRQAP
jgi:hypothetical protein